MREKTGVKGKVVVLHGKVRRSSWEYSTRSTEPTSLSKFKLLSSRMHAKQECLDAPNTLQPMPICMCLYPLAMLT